jgi:hypothetical protein
MTYYAKVNNEIVEKVISASQGFIDNIVDTSPGRWIETSDTGDFRKNYAGVGYTYDEARDAFYLPQPFPSWTLVEDTCQWEAPVAYPDGDKFYEWDEATTNWKENN